MIQTCYPFLILLDARKHIALYYKLKQIVRTQKLIFNFFIYSNVEIKFISNIIGSYELGCL